MSIKEQVEFAKEELTQDEKLLAGLIKIERFYKRNKMLILGLAAVLVFGGIGYGVMEYVKEQRLLAANQAFLKLQADPADKAALQTLKEKNPALAELVELKRAVADKDAQALERLRGSKDPVVSDVAAYHVAALKREEKGLAEYRMKTGALLKDFAALDEAYLRMAQGDVAKAREILAKIHEDSPLAPVAKMLGHYGIVARKGGE